MFDTDILHQSQVYQLEWNSAFPKVLASAKVYKLLHFLNKYNF